MRTPEPVRRLARATVGVLILLLAIATATVLGAGPASAAEVRTPSFEEIHVHLTPAETLYAAMATPTSHVICRDYVMPVVATGRVWPIDQDTCQNSVQACAMGALDSGRPAVTIVFRLDRMTLDLETGRLTVTSSVLCTS